MTSPNTEQMTGRRILILYEDESRCDELVECMQQCGFTAVVCNDSDMALVNVYNEPPDVILLHEDMGPGGGLNMARMLKQDNVYAHLPILLMIDPKNIEQLIKSDDLPIDDYISVDVAIEEITTRCRLCLLRAYRQLDANPLTRLPGNNSITKELEGRLARNEEFATVYADLDNFKAFNDRYGFARGDQAIQLTARLLVNTMSEVSRNDYYVGHVGGDDYVFIVPGNLAETACEKFIKNFDQIIISLYDDLDRKQGYIRSKNRKGEFEIFPLMSISLAVAVNRDGQFNHPGQISTISAELKKVLKKRNYSSYIIDRRTYDPETGKAIWTGKKDELLLSNPQEAAARIVPDQPDKERRLKDRRKRERRLDHRTQGISGSSESDA